MNRRGLVRRLIDSQYFVQVYCVDMKTTHISIYPKQNKRLLTRRRCRPPQGEAPTLPAYAVPNLTSYRRDAPLLLVHPILQHLLYFLSRRFILVFLFLRLLDRGPSLSILNGGTFLIVSRCCGRVGDWYGFGGVDTVGVILKKRCTSWIVRVRFYFERMSTSVD